MTEPPREWSPPPPGGRWRGVLILLPLAFWSFLYPLLGALFLLLWPRRLADLRHVLIRFWGRSGLALMGVRLEVHGRERLEGPGPALILFNHVSLLDLWLVTALWPRNGTVLYKREFDRIPILGFAMRVCGMIPIDRRNREEALRTLQEAAERIRRQNCRLIVAPEGTRSRRGGLQDFKMGPFHLAAETGAPVVPLIYRGVEAVLPMGAWIPRPGLVRADVLDPVPTADWKETDLRAQARELRALFLRYLPPAPGSEPCEART